MVLHLIGVKMNKNVLALAYLGDSIYEVYVRKYLLDKGIEKVNELQKEATNYVSARSQGKFLLDMINYINLLIHNDILNLNLLILLSYLQFGWF